MDRWVSDPAWHQTNFLPALEIPSSTNQPVWDAPQIPDHNVHCFDGHLGLEFTTEILTLRFTHRLELLVRNSRRDGFVAASLNPDCPFEQHNIEK